MIPILSPKYIRHFFFLVPYKHNDKVDGHLPHMSSHVESDGENNNLNKNILLTQICVKILNIVS